MLHSATKEYLTISAADNVSRASETIFIVLAMNKLIEEEPRLARDYRYQLSDTAKEVLTLANTEIAVK